MDIFEFVSQFRNHPVLFIGTGMSLRYLSNSYSWDGLLKKISFDLKGSNEFYLDIKSNHYVNGTYKYDTIATYLERKFNSTLVEDRNGKFKNINDQFYQLMENGINVSRFKLYIAEIFSKLEYRDTSEVTELKKVRKNISSIITTNYDCMLEEIFGFKQLIGNDILLSNPYGSLYKIHGSVNAPDKIIITQDDYEKFSQKYELIRAQLLSLFIHNPIIFIGYSIGDDNIKEILKTIFTYVDADSEAAEKVRSQFLLVEYDPGSSNVDVTEHDIDIEGLSTIRINRIKTDNYSAIYKSLAELQLPVSAMDIRKVQNVVKEIYEGGDIKVRITSDIDDLENSDKVLAIGSRNTITYSYQTAPELMKNYFSIIEEDNNRVLVLIDKLGIQSNQYFPIYAFAKIDPSMTKIEKLKNQQKAKLRGILEQTRTKIQEDNISIQDILDSEKYAQTYKQTIITCAILERKIPLEDVERYLKEIVNKCWKTTDYRKLLCAYDFMKYSGEEL
ncbi:MAG: SIR2 family protein [Lachnoanaerobaculum sp.]|uniref:SIR2 family protein n=1 Tax=Lachnoanaerobaculum sp. TaxID=2049030 RepID=UPI0025BB854E|nr:SIR2 family protein [Lachnoanaerobaculum sp.]MBS5881820.1 SIR2 family protein [Lachnoanaerobaculum sp.]